jgi:hypothetical protein
MAMALILMTCSSSFAAQSIDLGRVVLAPETAGQTFPVTVAGTDQAGGMDLYLQVGGGTSGPLITGLGMSAGTIWGDAAIQTPLPGGSARTALSMVVTARGTTLANGRVATVTVDTTGVRGGIYPMILNVGGYPADILDNGGTPLPLNLVDGTLVVPYVITAHAEAGGSILPSGKIPVNPDDDQRFSVIAASGYHITDVRVNGSSIGAMPSHTFTGVAADHAITASFKINEYTATYNAGGNGMVNGVKTVSQTVVHGGAGPVVTLIPADGYHFAGWSDGSMDNPRQDIGITGDVAVTARFKMEQVAIGSTFVMAAEDVSLTVFKAKPKVYATYVNPITEKAGKASAKVLDKIDKVEGNATLACEWTKKINLYDAKAFKASEAGGVGAAVWITEVNQSDLVMNLRLASKEVEDQPVKPLALVAPVIDAIANGGQDAMGNDTLIITGQWFGTKAPKVWREYVIQGKAGDIIKRQAMKVVKPTVDNTDCLDSKLKPACMQHDTGASKVIVVVPAESKGALNGTIVLESGVGLAAVTLR